MQAIITAIFLYLILVLTIYIPSRYSSREFKIIPGQWQSGLFVTELECSYLPSFIQNPWPRCFGSAYSLYCTDIRLDLNFKCTFQSSCNFYFLSYIVSFRLFYSQFWSLKKKVVHEFLQFKSWRLNCPHNTKLPKGR